ncbi:Uncharacterised protein [Mycolicibacterium vanbaalenii]|uniref:Uncharacterized protein n=1 Tax=Mycolicibacterium vanbaalenii TaxID=110539 RepID=A0A5S9MS80_MYCVN|nr:hypothetical protein [Mycolicibacterium vanbaalenii]CAA0078303.1 Uncharacterised protein [Mycolicibacterium vanbaalenii]
MFDPPPGYHDMLGDAEHNTRQSGYANLDVDEVGVVRARYPLPNAVPNLAMANTDKISRASQLMHLKRFLRAHVEDLDQYLVAMMDGTLPADTVERIAKAVAAWGTARPTLPSSVSV